MGRPKHKKTKIIDYLNRAGIAFIYLIPISSLCFGSTDLLIVLALIAAICFYIAAYISIF